MFHLFQSSSKTFWNDFIFFSYMELCSNVIRPTFSFRTWNNTRELFSVHNLKHFIMYPLLLQRSLITTLLGYIALGEAVEVFFVCVCVCAWVWTSRISLITWTKFWVIMTGRSYSYRSKTERWCRIIILPSRPCLFYFNNTLLVCIMDERKYGEVEEKKKKACDQTKCW